MTDAEIIPLRPDQPEPILPPRRPGKEVEPYVTEGELVDDAPVLVDQPATAPAVPAWSQRVELPPLVAPWVVDAEQRRATVLGWLRLRWRVLEYHSLRLPWYWWRLSAASPRGLARTIKRVADWAADGESARERQSLPAASNKEREMLLARQQTRAHSRRILLALAVAAVLAVGVLLAVNGVRWDLPAFVLGLAVLLGIPGQAADKPVIGPAVIRPEDKPLDSHQIIDAFASLGITAIGAAVKDGWAHRAFATPIRTDGPGWSVKIALPLGVTATDIMKRRDGLASGLRRPLSCVWPEPDHAEHAGMLDLYVSRQPMNTARMPPCPLEKASKVDLFGPVPVGVDQRGRVVTHTLMFANKLIGAMPRYGKTVAMRNDLLAASLDPRAELRIFELKGTGDLAPLEPVAHHYASGAGDDAVETCMASIREVHGLMKDRAARITKVAREQRVLCPENKVTAALAEKRSWGLFPIVLGIDECQVLYGHPEWGKEAADLCVDIIKRGPALGIILLLATQRPDKDSLPKGISDNIGIRFCLRVMGYLANDMVLGTGMHANGIQATMFSAKDKGIGYLIGDADDPQIVRTWNLNGAAAERIVARARAAREAAGTLSGYALGEQTFDTGPDRSLLRDLLQVFGPLEEKAHSDDLCARLADAWPARYAGWKPEQLAAGLKPFEVRTRQVWAAGMDGESANRRGVLREDVATAVGERVLEE